ncbi:MAG: hypothetical protein HYZ15_04850 [Sphingobacteriales bacterium]|nr:hypothetical protein [Sphingobacteriales bacterium]
MTLTLFLFISFIVLHFITAILVWQVWEKAAASWRPMLLFFVANFILEVIDAFVPVNTVFVFVKTGLLQALAAVLLILWQARVWKVFERRPFWYFIIFGVLLALWLFESLFFTHPSTGGSYFIVISSFCTTLLAIEMMNRNLPESQQVFWRNPVFLYCAGLIFHYTLLGLLELFGGYLKDSGQPALYKTYFFYSSISIFVQLLYIRSVLCIPAKDKYYTY